MASTTGLVREFFLGFVKVHVLHHAAEEPVYGLALIEELRRHGYQVGPGTIYPLLHGLAEAGYLTRTDRLVGGKVRKYYAITDRGARALAAARDKIAELTSEVLQGRGHGRLRHRGRPGTRPRLPGGCRPGVER